MRISDTLKIFNFQPFAIPSVITKPDVIWDFSNKKDFIPETNNDSFVPSTQQNPEDKITPKGTTDKDVLALAPKPDIIIAGQNKKAGIVVDINKNFLYTYDPNGNPTKAYMIASGQKGTPTEKGVRIVTHTETYPYKKAYGTKRKRKPKDYGPFVIILEKINPKTGEQSKTGEFIHGCRSYKATFETNPGRYVSHGCVRMDNNAIAEVKEVKSGTIVIIK